MVKKLFLFLLLFFVVFIFWAQNPDSIPTNIDSLVTSTSNLEDIIGLKAEVETQRLLKNFFLVGFAFMSIVVAFLLYFYHTKVKKIAADIDKYQENLIIQSFHIEQLSIIMNSLYENVLIIDNDTRILWGNPAFYSLVKFPHKPDEKNQKINFSDFADDDFIIYLKQVNNTKKMVEYDGELKTIDNKTIKVRRKIIPLIRDKDQKIENFAVIEKLKQ